MEKQRKEVKFKSVILSLAARKREGREERDWGLRCNLQAEMSPSNSKEISYMCPYWPSTATENSRGTFHEGTLQPP